MHEAALPLLNLAILGSFMALSVIGSGKDRKDR